MVGGVESRRIMGRTPHCTDADSTVMLSIMMMMMTIFMIMFLFGLLTIQT